MPDNNIVWPNNAKCAVTVTINLDAEYFWLSMFPDSIHRPKTLSMGQYGPNRGLQRVLDALDQYGISATFFVPGKVAEIYPDHIQEIVRRGHEIGHHGYAHENFGHLTVEQQREALEKGMESLEKVSGVRPVGFRAPEGEMTQGTLDLLQEMGFLYSSSLFGDDRPYFHKRDGQQTSLIELPLHWELNDFPFFAFNYTPAFPAGQGRIANYTQVLSTWKEELKGYYEYGLHYVAQFDPQTIGTPGRIALLEQLLEFIREKDDVWICNGCEMAEFYGVNRA